MKRMLCWLGTAALSLISYVGEAQTQCLPYDLFVARKDSLDNQYAPVYDVLDPDHRTRPIRENGVSFFSEMSPTERIAKQANSNFYKQFDKNLLSLGYLLGKLNGIELFVYVNEKGRIDCASYRLTKHTLNGFDQQQIDQSFCQFFSDYVFTQTNRKPYRIYSGQVLGTTLVDKQAHINRLTQEKVPQRGEIRTLAGLTTTRPDTVTIITLEQLALTKAPRALVRFKNIRQLNLNDNELTKVPRFVFRSKKLSSMNLSGNRLAASAIRCPRNKHIERINLQFNQLTQLPKRLPRNRHLLSLWLGHNNLSAGLDARILRRLKTITDLNLYNTKLTSLPATIGQLTQLETLDVYYNQLHELPREIGKNLALKQLALSYNRLDSLPDEIRKLTQLEALYVRKNLLAKLPVHIDELKTLHTLDISHNAISELPSSIINLSINTLQNLNISQNRLAHLPTGLFKTNRLKQLDISDNPATNKQKLTKLLPLIREAEAKHVTVRY